MSRQDRLHHPMFRAGLASCLVGLMFLAAGLGAVINSISASAQSTDWAAQQQFSSAITALSAIGCSTSSDCVAVGTNSTETSGVVVSTTDGGNTWNTETLPAGTGPLYGVFCVSSSDCWAVGSDATDTYGVIVSTTDGGSTWQTQTVSSAVGPLSGVTCSSSTDCWAVGTDSSTESVAVIVSTTDGGNTWNAQTISSAVGPLSAASCASSTDCWAVGTDSSSDSLGVVVSTTDGGDTWNTESVPSSIGPLAGVSCSSDTDCWAVGVDFATDSFGEVMSTTDGGNTWDVQDVPNGTGPLAGVSCTSATDCWAVGSGFDGVSGLVVATTDGGNTWSTQSVPNGTELLSSVSCVSSVNCWAVSNYDEAGVGIGVSTSTLGGSVSASGARDHHLADPSLRATHVLETDNIVDRALAAGSASGALGGDPLVVATVDGGTTWSSETVPSTGLFSLSSISCATSLACWALAIDGNGSQVVLATTDGWNTWTTESVPSGVGALIGISCPNISDCWAVGGEISISDSAISVSGSVVATTDGGSTWNVQSLPSGTGILASISCTSSSTCWTVGADVTGSSPTTFSTSAIALNTTDAGSTWTSQSIPSSAGILDGVSCASSSDCWAVGSDETETVGVIVATTDGGDTWNTQTVPNGTGPFTAVSCPSSTDCWAVGSSVEGITGTVLATSDGGNTWNVQSVTNDIEALTDISCPSTSDCWAASSGEEDEIGPSGAGSLIIATVDGGTTWIDQSVPDDTTGVPSLSCPTTSSCWASGTTSSGYSILSMVGTTTTPPSTTTTSPTSTTVPPTGVSPYELYCPGTPVGDIVLNGVTTTGTIAPATPTIGSTFQLTDYQDSVTIPAPIVIAAAALGNTTISGTASTTVSASGATPASLASSDVPFSIAIPSPVPSSGLTLTLPSPPATLGPFTATSSSISITAGSTTSLTLVVSGNEIPLTCTAYPNLTDPVSGIVAAFPPGAGPVSPLIATATASESSTTTTLPATTTTVGGTAAATAESSRPGTAGATQASSGSLAFTGVGALTRWTAVIGAALTLLGAALLVLVDRPRRLLMELSHIGRRRPPRLPAAGPETPPDGRPELNQPALRSAPPGKRMVRGAARSANRLLGR